MRLEGTYSSLKTTRVALVYGPRLSIKKGNQLIELTSRIDDMQKQLIANFRDKPYVVNRAEITDEFVVAMNANGEINFVSVASAKVSGEFRNTHKAKFLFCLLDTTEHCVKQTED